MEATFISTTILLFLVMDPLGGIPLFIAALKNVEETRKMRVVMRECLFAFIVLFVFLFFGARIMELLRLSQTSLGIAGGIILFLIAIRITFPSRTQGVFGDLPDVEPFIFPLAIPAIAGPSALATVLLLASRYPARMSEWILALIVSVSASALILVFGNRITRVIGARGVMAFERLAGLILTAVAVEMFLAGAKEFAAGL